MIVLSRLFVLLFAVLFALSARAAVHLEFVTRDVSKDCPTVGLRISPRLFVMPAKPGTAVTQNCVAVVDAYAWMDGDAEGERSEVKVTFGSLPAQAQVDLNGLFWEWRRGYPAALTQDFSVTAAAPDGTSVTKTYVARVPAPRAYAGLPSGPLALGLDSFTRVSGGCTIGRTVRGAWTYDSSPRIEPSCFVFGSNPGLVSVSCVVTLYDFGFGGTSLVMQTSELDPSTLAFDVYEGTQALRGFVAASPRGELELHLTRLRRDGSSEMAVCWGDLAGVLLP